MPKRGIERLADAEVEAWASELDDDFLGCRIWQHQWSRPRKYEWDTKRQAYRVMRRCRFCKAKRWSYEDRNGYAKANEYDYPDGFLRPKGAGTLDKQERALLRRENRRRAGVE